ncbi:winged helix-turn-helix domain-containing protein [Paraglaciecola sp.]|uniref:winged helix-turn-helix domain-containing protein n=1 Tax=Paraglaciecola sp. TaxID=1920173 RepID=UPI0030F3D478
MHKPYWVGDYLVDPSRNQIKRFEQTHLLQPKVVAVLNLLASKAGEVVSHEQLMSEVWPNVYVTPNTLQRCIAELRKVLGDNSKTQGVIKTHSKQGYSLELLVQVDKTTNILEGEPSNPAVYSQLKNTKLGWNSRTAILVLLVSFIAVFYWHISEEKVVIFNTLQPLTASDEKEFYPNYSPDGKYMVFHRYLDVCQNHIWAKDLSSQQEFRLTKSPGIYGAHSWSPDGNHLVFTLQENCSQNLDVKKLCWRLQTLDFYGALQSPQNSTLSYDCQTTRVEAPLWMTDGNILMIEFADNSRKLVKYDPVLNQLSNFYSAIDAQIQHVDYGPITQKIAIFSQSKLAGRSIKLLDLQANELAFIQLKIPEEMSVFARLEPSFLPDESGFVVNREGDLYHIDMNGEFSNISSPHAMNLHTPSYHPKQNKILATKGLVDADIGISNFSQDGQSRFNSGKGYLKLARSTSYDANGIFQPLSDKIAFLSKRSGSAQIWMTNIKGEQAFQLSKFKQNSSISSFVWSLNGQRLAVCVNDKLKLLSLDGQQVQLDTHFAVEQIYQWIDDKNLLLSVNDPELKQLIVFNIETKTSLKTGLDNVFWAQYAPQGELLYFDVNRRLWKKENGHTKQILGLEEHLDSKRFIMRQNKLYGVNWQNQLWQFDATSEQFAVLQQLNENVWWVSDIYDEQLLITEFVAAKQEIVELLPSFDYDYSKIIN